MNLNEKPILFAIAAAAVIAVGSVVTMLIPLLTPSTQPTSAYIKPYSAIEMEGRDIYIREGCNNCHTQTVRPLRTEVARYGEYSKAEESAYDRPFLWGSRRTGPDLARIGGKYPDAWHYRHTASPQGMFDKSNMPPYAWLAERGLDTAHSAGKAGVLGFGYSSEDVARQVDGFRKMVTAADYPGTPARDKVTPAALRGELTEMDALVAYLQKVGRDLKAVQARETSGVAAAAATETANPYAADRAAQAEGEAIFKTNCRSCHGEKGKGGFGPSLAAPKWKFGGSDAEVYASASGGRPGGMPSFEGTLGRERIWKVISYIRTLEKR